MNHTVNKKSRKIFYKLYYDFSIDIGELNDKDKVFNHHRLSSIDYIDYDENLKDKVLEHNKLTNERQEIQDKINKLTYEIFTKK